MGLKSYTGRIYSEGERKYSYPFRVYSLPARDSLQGRLIISVPKKLFKRAVKRNLIRRRIKEAYRRNCGDYPDLRDKDLLIVYVSNRILDYEDISRFLAEPMEKVR